MNKYLASLLFLLIPTLTYAEDKATITLSGNINSQIGVREQAKFFKTEQWDQAKLGAKLNNHMIVNDTKITIAFDGEHEGLQYGGKIRLNTDTSSSKTGNPNIADKVFTYVSGNFGRFELANAGGATDTMNVSAIGIARATGGIDGDAIYYINPITSDGYQVADAFVANPYLPFGCDCAGRIGKVTYYTPDVLNGLKFGFSYAPDSQVKGTISQARNIIKNSAVGYKHLFEVAVNYKYTMNDFDILLGALYQNAQAKKNDVNIKERKGVNAWELGAQIGYKGFTIAGSYGDWGRSGTKVDRAPGMKYGADFWNIGAAYEYAEFGASVTYYQSRRAGTQAFMVNGKELDDIKKATFVKDSNKYNKLEMLSVGMDYKLAPGLMPYAEVNHYKHNRADTAIDNKGYIYLVGTKLSF